jgi:galactose mutarotase-like enzyme
MENVVIKNDCLEVEISPIGAEMVRIKYNGEDKLWCGDESVWKGHSPILFPICGRLLNGYFLYDGKKYELQPHGVAKTSVFEVVSSEKTSATFLISSNEETKKVYPFDFNFRVHFKLQGDKICIYYIVENLSKKDMYFNVGCHEAYALNEDMKNYSIKFSENDSLNNLVYGENMMEYDGLTIDLKDKTLPLNLDYFVGSYEHKGKTIKKDSIILENIQSKEVTLLKNDEEVLSIYYKDFDNLVIWTKSDKFVAIEPWNGMPDYFDTDHKLENKKHIDKIKSGETKSFYHSITLY